MKRLYILLLLAGIISAGFYLKNTVNKDSEVSAQTQNTDWPQVQKDAQRSGYVPQTVAPPYTELWRVRYPVSSRVQPIIGAQQVYLPANDNALYAIKTSDGSLAWKFSTDGANINSAAYENGTVFFGSTDNYIYALNSSNGTLKWKYKTGSTVKTAPLLAEGKVFMGSSDGYFYALNQLNGQLLWRTNIGSPIYDTAAYDGGRVFFGGMDSKGYALDDAAGNTLWSTQMNGQGFRDRWTVAGNGKVFFTPMLAPNYHSALSDGTYLFHQGATPEIYNQPWSVQKQTILNYLAAKPHNQPIHVLNQDNGQASFIPPILYASGGGASPHSQVVLLPDGNADVIFRRTFTDPAQWGSTTGDALSTGQLNLQTGDIASYDQCDAWGSNTCLSSPFTSDESATLVRSGNVLYLDIARGTLGLDIPNKIRLNTLACYNPTSGGPFCDNAPIRFDDYCLVGSAVCTTTGGGWRIDYGNIYAEVDGDGNNLKRPTPIVGDTFYILHYGTLVAVKGTLR